MSDVRSDAFVFLGATGDLAYKKIFPALQAMAKRGHLDVPVIGVAKAGWNLEQFHAPAQDSIRNTRGLVPDVLPRPTQHGHPSHPLLAEQPGDAGIERGRDAIEHQDGRDLGATLDLREHATADAGAGGQRLEREAATGAGVADLATERLHAELRAVGGHRSLGPVDVFYRRIYPP